MAHRGPTDPIEELAVLAREFRHVRAEHDRVGTRGATRRKLRRTMDELAARFERGLEHWVRDDELRRAWRAHLHRGGDRPHAPRFSPPPVFRGRTPAGAMVEVRASLNGGYDLCVDGALVEHQLPRDIAPERIEPVRIGEWICEESFSAPDDAVEALRMFVEGPRGEPPWAWARELFEDGLVDASFALTLRGARRLGIPAPLRVASPGAFCILAIDRARARIFTFVPRDPIGRLFEVDDIGNPLERSRDSALFSDTRPGVRREGPGAPAHGVSDRRERQREEHTRRFVEQVLTRAAETWRRFPSCTIVAVASPRMLGVLRPAIARHLHGPTPYRVVEHAAELTGLAASALHDALASAGVLPERGRAAADSLRAPSTKRGVV